MAVRSAPHQQHKKHYAPSLLLALTLLIAAARHTLPLRVTSISGVGTLPSEHFDFVS
jgi:hypothetical protein